VFNIKREGKMRSAIIIGALIVAYSVNQPMFDNDIWRVVIIMLSVLSYTIWDFVEFAHKVKK